MTSLGRSATLARRSQCEPERSYSLIQVKQKFTFNVAPTHPQLGKRRR